MEYRSVAPAEFPTLEGVDDWTVVEGSAIAAVFRAPSYPIAADLVVRIAAIAEERAHHPDMEIRYPGRVRVTLTTHATGGLTTLDVDLARLVSAIAAESGATPEHP